ncbi:MAG: autotransporter domain-containing protein [Pseudomonadota bacterium]
MSESSTANYRNNFFAFFEVGPAKASLTVSPPGDIQLTKSFEGDPVGPGDTVELLFTLRNVDRASAATNLSFTDDLNAMLSGTTLQSVGANSCTNGSVSGVGTGLITFSGATLAPGATCTVSVNVAVPSGASPGIYTNTTSNFTGQIGGSAVTGDPATDTLSIPNALPILSMFFLNNPADGGDAVTVEFTITNSSSTTALSELTFNFPFQAFFSGATASNFPAGGSCGSGSNFFQGSSGGNQEFTMTSASLAPGASCIFSFTMTLANNTPSGDVTATTSQISGRAGGATVAGSATSATLSVGGDNEINFSKSFQTNPVVAGNSTVLEFTLAAPAENAVDVTGVTFTDDLNAMLAGTTATGLPIANACGDGTLSGSSGNSLLTLSGATLSPGETCVISVSVAIPSGASAGDVTNTTSSLTGSAGAATVTSQPAEDTLTVQTDGTRPPVATMEFLNGPFLPGETVTLRYTITNPNTSGDWTSGGFTQNFPSAVAGLAASAPLPSDPCGSGSSLTGTNFLILTGSNLTAGASCTFDVNVAIPVSASDGTFGTSTSALFGDMSGTAVSGDPASATLVIQSNFLLATKSFLTDPVLPGNSATLQFTIRNDSATRTVTGITFTDDLDAMLTGAAATGLPTASVCGASSNLSGTSTISLTGGELSPGASCTFSVPVSIPGGATPGSYDNVTSTVTGSVGGLSVNGIPAQATLNVAASAAPVFSKAFSVATTPVGSTVDLTFTIQNPGTSALTGFGFVDDLSAFLAGAQATNTPVAGCGGSLEGTTSLAFTGGSLAAGSTCTITTTIQIPGTAAPGTYTNTTSDLSSGGLSIAAAATANLQVINSADLSVSITDNTDPIFAGGTVIYTVNVANAGPNAAADTVSTFTLPGGLSFVSTSGCAGDPNGVPSCALGSIAAGSSASYTVTAMATATASGLQTVSASVATSATDPVAGNNTGTQGTTVNPSADISITKTDGLTSVQAGGTLNYTIVVSNAGPSTDPSVGVGDTFPSELTCNYTSLAAGGATGNTGAGSGNLSETLSMPSGSSVTYTASCTVSDTATGTLMNTATASASVNDPDTGNNSASDNDTTVVVPMLTFTQAFAPATIAQGDVSRVTFTIDNTANLVNVTSLAFTNALPTGVEVAPAPNASSTCGAFNATAGATSLNLSGGTLAASSSCTVAVDVRGVSFGTFVNTTSTLTSNVPDAPPAQAVLTVTAFPLDAVMVFNPVTINQFETTTVTYTLRNFSSLQATGVALTDTLPAGVTIANPNAASSTCGGTLTATPGASDITLAGGIVGDRSTCDISVSVTAANQGSFTNATESLVSNLGTSTPASANLTVNAAVAGNLTIIQNTDFNGTYTFTSTTTDLNFTLNTVGGTATFGPISIVAGAYQITQTRPDGVGNTSITCNDANSTGDPGSGVLNINIEVTENLVCTFTSIETRQTTVNTINRFLTQRADLIMSTAPNNSRRIGRLQRGSDNPTRLSFTRGDLYALLPFTMQLGNGGDYTFSTDLGQVTQAINSVPLAFGDPGDTRLIDSYKWDVWVQLQHKRFESGQNDGRFSILHFGVDYLMNPDLLVGAMVQVDYLEDRNGAQNSSVDGTGWMVGPYVTARLKENLYFDGRVAAGTSKNDISPFGTYTDEFDTFRWMASAEFIGDFKAGDWTIRPATSLSYFEEKQYGYVDGANVFIPSQTVAVGQFRLGPTFVHTYVSPEGVRYGSTFGFDAIYNFSNTSGATVTNPSSAASDGWRGRVQAGVDFGLGGGATMNVMSSYDGIGRSSLNIWGLSLEVNVPIQKATAR